jgi:hypothetical protein
VRTAARRCCLFAIGDPILVRAVVAQLKVAAFHAHTYQDVASLRLRYLHRPSLTWSGRSLLDLFIHWKRPPWLVKY